MRKAFVKAAFVIAVLFLVISCRKKDSPSPAGESVATPAPDMSPAPPPALLPQPTAPALSIPAYKYLTLDIGKGMSMDFALIPAGKFIMGSPKTEKGRNARDGYENQHEVTISKPFYLGKFPVTQEQWQAVMGPHHSFSTADKEPVTNVSWYDCQDFVSKVNQKLQGHKAFVLTEAQWEYACRAGTTTMYNTGDGVKALEEAGWIANNSHVKPRPLGERKPNAWGLYGMNGCVWQWCDDEFELYPAGPVTDPTGPNQPGNTVHVIRGGACCCNPEMCRSAYRYPAPDSSQGANDGFRLAVTADAN